MNQEQQNHLNNLLSKMNIPDSRRRDYNWLIRNLAVKNEEHKYFEETMKLILKILKARNLLKKSDEKYILKQLQEGKESEDQSS